jgi:hypothetical protein
MARVFSIMAGLMIAAAGCQSDTSGKSVAPNGSGPAAIPSKPSGVAAEDRRDLVEIGDIETHRGNGAVDGIGVVTATIRNVGTASLKRVSVRVSFLNADGRVVRREVYSPVAVYGGYAVAPLAPGETRTWSGGFWDIPEDWSGAVDVTVTDVEFTSSNTPAENRTQGSGH